MLYKRILTVQDISCVGQCSMTVAMPILSACGHEVCILPAAILSTHTGGFGKPTVQKLGSWMKEAVAHWKEQGITFDLVSVGYLGSIEAVTIAQEIIDTMVAPGGITVVDPALADHGKRYSGLDEDYAQAMFRLCEKADVMIPNITEAAMMCGASYKDVLDEAYVQDLMNRLPGKNVLLTGVGFGPDQTGFALRTADGIKTHIHPMVKGHYSGTGDMFAAVFCGALASGREMMDAAILAAQFVQKAIETTRENPAHWYGVKFEPVLAELSRLLSERN